MMIVRCKVTKRISGVLGNRVCCQLVDHGSSKLKCFREGGKEDKMVSLQVTVIVLFVPSNSPFPVRNSDLGRESERHTWYSGYLWSSELRKLP